MRAKITSFHATSSGVVANGTLTGKLRSGTSVSRDSAPVRFRVAAARRGRRCDVITLRLAPLTLELLGVQVKTTHISLDVYARKGRVLGDLFCALSRAKVTFPRSARVARALNSRLDGRSLRVFAACSSLPASAAQAQPQSCQVLKLVLGPLHLDLLGLVVDLYGKTHNDPVIVTINAQPNKGLLGQLLCGLAGGGGVSDLAGLQSLLSSLGVNLSTTQLQGVLNPARHRQPVWRADATRPQPHPGGARPRPEPPGRLTLMTRGPGDRRGLRRPRRKAVLSGEHPGNNPLRGVDLAGAR